MCSVYGDARNLCHPSQNCPLLLDGCRCFKCLGSHPRSDCPNSIPRSLDSCPKCHLLHNGQALGNVQLHEGRYGVDCPGQIRGERYRNSSLGHLASQPVEHAQGHAGIERHHSR